MSPLMRREGWRATKMERRRRSAAGRLVLLAVATNACSSGPIVAVAATPLARRTPVSCFVPSAEIRTNPSMYAWRRRSDASPSLLRSTEESIDNDGLTAQERILRSAGLSAETPEERDARLQRRAEAEAKLKSEKRINIGVAVLAFVAAFLNYGWKLSHPVTPVQVLAEMQSTSAPVNVIGKNGKPTVVDFWAPWCENCKMSAPTLQAIEKEYDGKVNFVVVNADAGSSWELVERFGVDAIPHIAMISAEGDVETALIGPIPRGVLRADLDVLLENAAAKPNESCDIAATTTSSVGSMNQEMTTVASSSVAMAGGEPAKSVVLPYEVPTKTTDRQQATSCEKNKEELPYVMLDVFRNRPEMRRINF